MAANSGIPRIGGKIRRLRRQRNMNQSDLASALGISASYLNLIEHNRRNVTVPLLLKIAGYFGLEITDLSESDEVRLANDLMECFGDDIFADSDITNMDVRDVASSNPTIAKAMLHLYDALQNMKNNQSAVGADSQDRLTGKGLASEPVSDFLQANSNYFPSLEAAAARILADVDEGEDLQNGLCAFLSNSFGVRTAITSLPDRISRRYDPDSRKLEIAQTLTPESRVFQIAAQIALLAAGGEIDNLTDNGQFATPDADILAKTALASYSAAAILMPYERFLAAARNVRYDIDLLAQQFEVSFEQVCHRLTSLQKPGAKGLPFHMVRSDIAGNISKRFSLSGIHIPRHSGACPRWNVYTAFLHPGHINVQISEMPDRKRYFCIARTIVKGEHRYGAQQRYLSIGLGIEMSYADQMVYSDGIDLKDERNVVPIGVSCRVCPRLECSNRAFPPVDHELNLDVNRRGASAYVSS
ncbi:MAG: XRE family transcriptional regulator [Hyphomicrobiales bacterium]|nr:MAG: XRE family transcriptional regulator [Hyphomicrobiales bacterium]